MGRAGNNALVMVGLLVAFLAMKLASRDDPAPQDADLIPAAVPAAGPGDAYPVFLKLNAALPLSLQEGELLTKQLDGKGSDRAAVEALIVRSTEALALFSDLSRCPTFQDPNYRDLATVGPYTHIPVFRAVVAAARMDSIQAESLLKKGRAEEALAKALLIVDAGRVFTRSHPQMIAEMVGMLVMNIGAKRALQVATSGKLGRAQLLNASARLSSPTGAASGLQDALRYEYVVQVYALDHLPELAVKGQGNPNIPRNLMIAAAARGGWYIYMPHRTKALVSVRFRPFVEEAVKPCLQARVPPFEVLPVGLRPNMVGRILYNIAVPSYEKLFTRRCETDFHMTQAAAAAALQAYRLDHGRFPASLSELTPGYLATGAVDPFNGAALLYSADSGEVHSAGKDTDGKPL